MDLGNKIKQLRIKSGLTQKELADKIYISYQAVSRWERNETEPNIQMINLMANVFKCDPSEIVSDETNVNRKKKKDRILKMSILILSSVIIALCVTIPLVVINVFNPYEKIPNYGKVVSQESLIKEYNNDVSIKNNQFFNINKDIIRDFDPELRPNEGIFYGSEIFPTYVDLEDSFYPYKVQNHSMKNCSDDDFDLYGKYLVSSYGPKYVVIESPMSNFTMTTETENEKMAREVFDKKTILLDKLHQLMPDTKLILLSGLLSTKWNIYLDATLMLNNMCRNYVSSHDYVSFIDISNLTYNSISKEYISSAFVDESTLKNTALESLKNDYIVPRLQGVGAPIYS